MATTIFRSVGEPSIRFTKDFNFLTRHLTRIEDFLCGMGVEKVQTHHDFVWILTMTVSQKERWDIWLEKLL